MINVPDLQVAPLPPLADSLVPCVGYPIAAVVADDRYQARDAADLVEVDYEPLPAVVDAERALEPDAAGPLPGISAPTWRCDFLKKAATSTGRSRKRRGRCGCGWSTRGWPRSRSSRGAILAHLRPRDGPPDGLALDPVAFGARSALAAALRRPEESIRVIAPDIGGAFGAKSRCTRTRSRWCCWRWSWACRSAGSRPAWRTSSSRCRAAIRSDVAEVAFTDDGIITGSQGALDPATSAAILHGHGTAAPPLRMPNYATGAYRIPAHRAEALGVYTNTVPNGAYRGAGRPEAAFLAERVIDEVARTLATRPGRGAAAQLHSARRSSPTARPSARSTTAVTTRRRWSECWSWSGYAELRDQQRLEAAARPRARPPRELPGSLRLLGIGLATTIEVSGQGRESGAIEVEADGTVVARTGSVPHGQGHETALPRWWRTASRCRSNGCECSTATRTTRRAAAARSAAAAWRSAAGRCERGR